MAVYKEKKKEMAVYKEKKGNPMLGCLGLFGLGMIIRVAKSGHLIAGSW